MLKRSRISFISLPTGTLYKKPEKKKLKIFPAGYVGKFYRNLADNVDNFAGSEFYGKIANDANIPSEDIQKYILATSDFGKGIQIDINHYVTRDRIDNASFRQKLDPISKDILRRQNPIELVFEDISTFNAENSVAGSLLKELDVGKKDVVSELIKNASGPPRVDFVIKDRLHKLKDRQEFENNNNNNNLSPPQSPPPPLSFFSQQPSLPLSPISVPPHQPFLPPHPPTLPPYQQQQQFPTQPAFPSTDSLFGSQVLTKVKEEETKDRVLEEIDDKIYEIPDLPKLELGYDLASILGTEAEDILMKIL